MPEFYDRILAPFIEQVDKNWKNPAVEVENRTYTYEDFIRRVLAIAGEVQAMPGDAVGLYTDVHVDTYAAIWAIWLCGKHYVPLISQAPEARNDVMLLDAGVKACIDTALMSTWPSYDGEVDEALAEYTVGREGYDAQPAYVLFTSGSTGQPKGVLITKKNLAAYMQSFGGLGYDVCSSDRILQPFELSFDLSIMSYLMAFVHGACLYPLSKKVHKVSGIATLLEEAQITITVLVPSLLQFLRPYFEELQFPHLRLVAFCGEPLPEDVVAEWAVCCPNAQLDNVYGPTEGTIICSRYTYQRAEPNLGRHGILTLGYPMAGNVLMVIDELGEFVPDGEAGELILSGPQVMPGYLNRPALNEAVFIQRMYAGEERTFYRTGDWVVREPDGRFDYISRIDFQVKVQGHRVELGEIEYQLRGLLKTPLPLLVHAIKNKREQFELVLFIESEEFLMDDVMASLRDRLPSYMLPSHIVFVPAFPLNKNGKTDRNALAAHWLQLTQ